MHPPPRGGGGFFPGLWGREKADMRTFAIFARSPRCVTNSAMGIQTASPPGGDIASMDNRRSSFEYEDLLACGRGELFGPGNAQLPLPPMLMFDRISEIPETGGPHGKGLEIGRASCR